MRFSDLKVPGAKLIEPDVFHDARGFFKEVFSAQKYRSGGVEDVFVQDNVSWSRRGVLRGLHYDARMSKLVQCLDGEIFDVVVDMRNESNAYRRWDAAILSGENHRQLYVPPGCAHGFYVLSESATVLYKQSAHYDPQHERIACWNDPQIAVEWPFEGTPVLSEKDAAAC